MKKFITYQIDSFTKEKFKDNPAGIEVAGVVVNADGLDDKHMQIIERHYGRNTLWQFT